MIKLTDITDPIAHAAYVVAKAADDALPKKMSKDDMLNNHIRKVRLAVLELAAHVEGVSSTHLELVK